MFGRKRSSVGKPDQSVEPTAPAEPARGPFDSEDVDLGDGVERLDLGGLVLPQMPGYEVQLQVDETTQAVQAVLVASGEGAVELRAFAAPRGGDLWGEVRPEIAADMTSHGGQVEEREGPFGPELMGAVPVAMADGTSGVQPSRIVGVNGPRWLLRATYLGRPAIDLDASEGWDDLVAGVIVHRGSEAMPVGDPLPMRLPPGAHRHE